MKHKRRHGEGRARLVAREHRQQFVFEFGFVRGAVSQPVAERFEFIIGPAAAQRPCWPFGGRFDAVGVIVHTASRYPIDCVALAPGGRP